MKIRGNKYVVILLITALAWLFTNQAMYSHAHLLRGGQIVRHAHPYTPDKNSHSPFQSHEHNSSVAFFLDLITSLNVDSFGSMKFFLIFLTFLATVPVIKSVLPYQPCYFYEVGRAPPRLH